MGKLEEQPGLLRLGAAWPWYDHWRRCEHSGRLLVIRTLPVHYKLICQQILCGQGQPRERI
jgi:hypothetical protein